MYNYLEGKIEDIYFDSIVLDVNGIGYLLFVSHPGDFHRGEHRRVPVYLHIKEDGHILYGFVSREEKELFVKLIGVNGIGPKTAIGVLSGTTVSSLVQAIETGNTTQLKKLPGIGPKAAQQIILDLKGKLILDTNPKVASTLTSEMEDAREGLRALGFKVAEIDAAFSRIEDRTLTSDAYLKLALKLLKK